MSDIDAREFGIQLVQMFAVQIPEILVCLGGLLLAANGYRRAPRPSLLVLMATGLLLFNIFVLGALQLVVIHQSRTSSIHALLMVLGFVRNVAAAISYGLLFVAVYTGRTVAVAPQPPRAAA